MGKGNRGFKPQGMVNPIMMARLSRPVQTGPTIRDRLEREGRPSWDEVKKVVVKKEKAASDFLEQWENDHYREELEAIREAKRGEQERQHLKELQRLSRKQNATRRRSSTPSSDSENYQSSTDDDKSPRCRSRKHKHHLGHHAGHHRSRSKESATRATQRDAKHHSKRRHRSRERSRSSDRHPKRRFKKDVSKFNPHKFSSFLKMTSDY